MSCVCLGGKLSIDDNELRYLLTQMYHALLTGGLRIGVAMPDAKLPV